MKRIGIDARFWGEAGPGRYVSNLVWELERVDKENKYFVFLTKKGYEEYKPQNKNFTKVLANYRWYTFEEQLKYPKLLYQYNLDLLHFGQFNMPFLYLRPFTVTIHDMILHDYPIKKGGLKNRLMYPIKRLGYLANFWWSAKKSRAIVVPSKDAKNDLITRLNIPSDKVTVTMEGFDSRLSRMKTKSSILEKKYSVVKPYLLFVGSMYPHKNLDTLVEAFSLLNEKINLILVGKESFFSNKLKRKVRKMKLQDKISFPGEKIRDGYVPDEDLPAFYENASAFVFPSLKEGFGIPPLEAMAFGIPVVASKISCIPEVCGGAALYFNPKDAKDIAFKIDTLLKDKKLQKELVRKGKDNVKKFSWERMAIQTHKVFEKNL